MLLLDMVSFASSEQGQCSKSGGQGVEKRDGCLN